MTRRWRWAVSTVIVAAICVPFASAAPSVAAPSAAGSASVLVIVPITVPPVSAGLLDAETLTSYTGVTGLLTQELNAVINKPVTLAVDPMIVASIRVLGDDVPPTASAWLARLEASTNERFALQWADANVTAPMQVGNARVLAPTSLDFALDPSAFSTETATPTDSPEPSTTATPGAGGGAPPLPTTASLQEVSRAVGGVVWPRASSVSAKNLKTAAASGFGVAILSPDNVSTATSNAVVRIGDTSVIVTNPTVSASFEQAVRTGTGVPAIRAVIAANAGSTTVIALDREIQWTQASFGRSIGALFAGSSIRQATLSQLAANASVSAKVVDHENEASYLGSVATAMERERLDRGFATITENPAVIAGQRRVELLAALSNGWLDGTDQSRNALQAFDDASTTLRSSVKVVKSSSILLLADRSTIPVVVENSLDQAVTVYVSVRPTTPLLSVENSRVELTIGPNSQRKALVPVQSLSNGEVDLRVGVLRADGGLVGAAKTVRITVQAGWETPVTYVMAGIVVVILVLGFYRTISKRRAARAASNDD